MADFVTLEEARDHLGVDNDAVNSWLATWIPGVSAAVQAWLKDEWRAYILATDADGNVLTDSADVPIIALDSNGEATVKPLVKIATLVELAQQRKNREGTNTLHVPPHWGHGYTLGVGATSLLTPLRKATVA